MEQKLKHRWSIKHNYLAGITFGKWLKLLMQNGFSISPAYWHRAVFITIASILNSGYALIDKIRYTKIINQVQITQPPLFILGHWRSGTTLLHDLLAQDDTKFNYANTYQVVNPYTFLTTENFMTRMFPWLVPDKRPMDNMALKFSSPQEDEFAPLLMTLNSVYLGTSFPNNEEYYDKFLSFRGVERSKIEEWKTALLYFCKKLSLNDDRSLLLKSPPHTARIRTILEIFPDARFIHIHRDPYRVFQSQRHFFDTAGWYTYLQRPDVTKIDEGLLQRHETMYDAYFEDLPLVAKDRIYDIAFKDLENVPIGTLKKAYKHLSLDGFDSFEPKLQRYVSSLKEYKKNNFSELDDATRAIVAKRWERSFKTWNYPQ